MTLPALDNRLRLLISGVPVVAVVLLQHLPLPGVTPPDGVPLAAAASAGLLGVRPFLAAALIVELCALLIPRWRPLRRPSGRPTLRRAALALAFAFAALQAYLMAVGLEALAYAGTPVVHDPGPLFRTLVTATVVGGFAITWLAASVGSAYGLVDGIAAVALFDIGRATWESMHSQVSGLLALRGDGQTTPATWLAIGGAWMVLLTLAHRVRPLPASAAAGPGPVGGVLAPAIGFWIARIAHFSTISGELAATIAVAAAFAALFHQPSRVAPWLPAEEAEVRKAYPAVIAHTIVVSLAVWVLQRVSIAVAIPLDASAAALAYGLARGLIDEWRWREAVPQSVVAALIEQPHAADGAVKALIAAGIPASGRNLWYRIFTPFHGCWAPVEILVPADRAVDARAQILAIA